MYTAIRPITGILSWFTSLAQLDPGSAVAENASFPVLPEPLANPSLYTYCRYYSTAKFTYSHANPAQVNGSVIIEESPSDF